MNYEEQVEFLKSMNFIPTGFGGNWSNGKYIAQVGFINDAVVITMIKKL